MTSRVAKLEETLVTEININMLNFDEFGDIKDNIAHLPEAVEERTQEPFTDIMVNGLQRLKSWCKDRDPKWR